MIGQTIDGKYRVIRQLGAGAMGEVYEAEHLGTRRRVAVKVMTSGDYSKNPDLVSRFQREAKAAGGIDTQHITQVLDTGVDGVTGQPFMVMEMLVGEDLQQLVRRVGPLSPDLALRILAQACIGLQKAHEAGVVHRDIKPANLFLARKDAGEIIVKVLDFGIAKVKMDHANDTANAGLTRTGSMMGSPLYMSPEQARGMKNLDHRADLWSLGVVLYESLCAKTPYEHIDALGELIIAICSEHPVPVQSHAPWVPAEVAQIVHRALVHNREHRFQSASAVLEAIRPLVPYGWSVHEKQLQGMSPEARAMAATKLNVHEGLVGTAMLGATAAAGALARSQAGEAKKPRSVAVPILVGALVVGAGVGGGFLAMRKPPAPTVAAAQTAATELAPATAGPSANASPSASATAASADPAEAVHRVRVAVAPADAKVEIAGKPVPVADGGFDLRGAPGSEHEVTVTHGAHKKTFTVVVTLTGARPEELAVAGPAVASAKDPRGPATTSPGSTTPAGAKTAKPVATAAPTTGLVTDFN